MKFNGSTIKKVFLGAVAITAGYLGVVSTTGGGGGGNAGPGYVVQVQIETQVYKTVGETDIELDVYIPPGDETNRTAIIFVHGGGWTSGSRSIHAGHCDYYARAGVVAVNIDYRLVAGSVDLFDQVEDVRAAVRWVRENAATYGIDPDEIILCGESAGGHLAGVAGFVDAFDDAGGDQGVSSRPNGVVLIDPITYLPGIPWYEGHPAQVGATPVPDDLTQLTPASTGADESLRLSPLLYAAIPDQPDVLLIHGDEDSVVPYAQSSDFHDLLTAAGNTSTLVTMTGSDHAFFLPGYGTEEEITTTLEAIDAFIAVRYGQYALLEPVGEWATWDAAPAYSLNVSRGQVFNVLDYGADPSNQTDSTDAIRATIAASKAWQEANGGALVTVYIPKGVYAVWSEGPSPEADRLIFVLHQSNLVIEGDGPTESIINCRAWDGQDPMDEIANRGILFTTLNPTAPIDGITIRGLRCTGNASPTALAGKWWVDLEADPPLDQSLTGWDIQNKGLGIWGNENTVTNIRTELCEWDNWRGEVLYSGGAAELGDLFVNDCIVRGSNASAISMGGYVTVNNVWIKAVYNGTECFSLTPGQGLEVTNCVINPNDGLPDGLADIGLFGVVYLGVSTASLEVTNCEIGRTLSGGVFLSEAASNVVISDNDFTDTVGIYSLYLNQYPNEPNFQGIEPNRWVNHVYERNTLTATGKNVGGSIISFAAPGEDWTIADWTLIRENGYTIDKFIDVTGANPDFIVTGNTLPDSVIPAVIGNGSRPSVWSGNTITGYYADGQVLTTADADTTPLVIYPSWPKLNYTSQSAVQRRLRLGADDDLSWMPTGFYVEFRRTADLAAYRGLEIQPDPVWNTLTRGYIIPQGAVLTLTKSAAGKMDLTTWTPPASSPPTFNETVATEQFDTSNIMLFGQSSATLSPSTPITYSAIYGVGIRDTVTLNYNANVTLEHVPGMMETFTGADFVAGGSGSISAYRDVDGTVLLGDHSANEDTPLIGVTTFGAASDAGHAIRVTIIQDGDHPAAAGGYYSVERKDPGGSFIEVEQVPKGDFTGTRLTATFDDTDWTAGEEYNYRVRAVDPGTPDNFSRYSNTQAKTVLAAPTDVSGLSYLLRASFSETGGTAYWFVSTSATPPADITSEADPDAEYWYSTTPTRGVNNKYVTGLAAGTYYLHVAQEGLTQTSGITTSAAFVVE